VAGIHSAGHAGAAARRDGSVWLVSIVTLVGIGMMLLIAPIPQDPAYHHFVDTRTLFGVRNFWDVVSNVAFLVVGISGLARTGRLAAPDLRAEYATFCIGVIAVAFGSGYYHLTPATPTLVWDRLPMAVAFMALFSAVLRDRTSLNRGGALLWPLVALGVASVLYWAWTEANGRGDLRPYALVQFLPLVLMPLLLLFYRGTRQSEPWLWGTFAAYGLAKVSEYFDAPIYQAVGLSGHTIKHLLSAVAVLLATVALRRMVPAQRLPAARIQ
jgi:hypothetical protein